MMFQSYNHIMKCESSLDHKLVLVSVFGQTIIMAIFKEIMLIIILKRNALFIKIYSNI